MSENINENVSVNKERENHREYNKTRKYNSRNRKPGDNNTKKPMGKQKNFRYKQQKTNSRHYEKHSDRQEIAAAGELAETMIIFIVRQLPEQRQTGWLESMEQER